jgi:hypothetical protein
MITTYIKLVQSDNINKKEKYSQKNTRKLLMSIFDWIRFEYFLHMGNTIVIINKLWNVFKTDWYLVKTEIYYYLFNSLLWLNYNLFELYNCCNNYQAQYKMMDRGGVVTTPWSVVCCDWWVLTVHLMSYLVAIYLVM